MLRFIHPQVKTELTLQKMKYTAKSGSFLVAVEQRLSALFKILFLYKTYTFLTQYLCLWVWHDVGMSYFGHIY